jgi:hypothetical protein
METNPLPDATLMAALATTKRTYEWARLRRSVLLASSMVGLAAGVAWLAGSARGWWPFVVAATLLAAVEFRGQTAMKGARRGYLAGLALLAAPLALLRPCCIGMDMAAMGANCCTMPSMCAGVGVAIGAALSLARPSSGSRLEGAFGLWLGVASIASMRCTGLFMGEAVGLLGGLMSGIVVSSAAQAAFNRVKTAR